MKQYFLTLICTLSFVISLQSQEKIFHLDVGWSIAKQEQIPTKVSISGKPKQIEALPCKIYLFNGLDDGIRIEDWTAKSFFLKIKVSQSNFISNRKKIPMRKLGVTLPLWDLWFLRQKANPILHGCSSMPPKEY